MVSTERQSHGALITLTETSVSGVWTFILVVVPCLSPSVGYLQRGVLGGLSGTWRLSCSSEAFIVCLTQ